MNPLFSSLFGANSPVSGRTGQSAPVMPNAPLGGINGVFQRAQQIMNSIQNPQQIVQRYFPDAPTDISGDPEQIISWLQQTGRVAPQTVQMARQMMGR